MSLSKVDDEDKQIVTDGDEQRTDDIAESRRINNGEAVDRLDLPLVSQR